MSSTRGKIIVRSGRKDVFLFLIKNTSVSIKLKEYMAGKSTHTATTPE